MTIDHLAPIPRSTAETAWELCRDVIAAIEAEPKRANMTRFHGYRFPEDGGPACGTVGCFAGWICVLTGTTDPVNEWHDDAAERLLGPEVNYHTVGDHGYVFNAGQGDACAATTPGTPAHAAAVIARIRRFMCVNEQALKARRLPR